MIPIERHYDASRINEILNHPIVRPDIADLSEGVIDISRQVSNQHNVVLIGEYGGFFLFCIQPGVYEVHTAILPQGRGEWSAKFARSGIQWMFTRTPAFEIATRVPEGHIAARTLAVANGMRHEFTRPAATKFRGEIVDMHIYSTRVQDWTAKADTVERGRWFHERLHQEAKRCGITAPAHEDDENHNRYVGAVYEMILGGEIEKAVLLYNRWAVLSRHPTIALVSKDPMPVVKMDIGYLQLRGDDFELVRPC